MTLLLLCLLIAQGDQWTGVPDDLACRGRRQLLHVHLADGLRLQGLDASGQKLMVGRLHIYMADN